MDGPRDFLSELTVHELDVAPDALDRDLQGFPGLTNVVVHGERQVARLLAVFVALGGVQADGRSDVALEAVEGVSVESLRERDLYLEGLALGVGSLVDRELAGVLRLDDLVL